MMNVSWNYQGHRRDRDGEKSLCVVSPDPCFYQLDEFCDERLVLFHLRRAFDVDGVSDRCEILRVRYIFKKSFHVAYRLGSLVLLVRFFPRGESLSRYQEALSGASDKNSVVHLPEWDAIAWRFPEDPGLPFLPAMIDTHSIAHRLSRFIDLPLDPEGITWDLISYRPGKRCSIRYQLPQTDHVLIGKMQESIAQGHRTLVRLWESPDRRFRMPRPIGLDEEVGVRWESFVGGERLEEIFSEVDLDSLIERIVRDLVRLHAISIEHLMPNGLEQVIHRMSRKIIPRMCDTLFSLAPALNVFYTELVQRAGSLPKGSRMTIHGDLHTANMLIDQEGLIFLDMDQLAIGDPEYDLALLGGRLLLMALIRGERVREVADVIATLPEAYEAAAGCRIPHQRFAWYMAALLVGRQIKTCIGHRAPQLDWLAPALLAYARETLERGRFDASLF